MPSTKYLWKTTNMTTIGRADITVPAGGNLYGGDRFEIELTIR